MQAATVRSSFLEFFASRAHQPVASSSLVPHGDPTLLFTNAGMVQFKRVFQGLEHRDYARAVTVQKCVRAGGKHNDLEQVGHTARHHTFFEMLGNFSFGDYFKKDAIAFAWEWVTSERYLGVHPDRIFVTVHHSDDDARRLWHSVTGIAESRIYGLGDKDNFWQMGDTGPCGPCSEIYVDLRKASGTTERRNGGPNAAAAPIDVPAYRPAAVPTLPQFVELAEMGALLEIWNLVFMQFDQAADGTRSNLPAPSVDTGAGLERIAAVLQGVDSNFHTDLFLPIIRRAEEVVGQAYDRGDAGAGFRVLADHARAVAFLLADGVYPSNDGRGYVLRRILRRAVRHAYLLGRSEPTLTPLALTVVDAMGDVFPELREKRAQIEKVTRLEEERFLETVEGGLERLEQILAGPGRTVSGADAFKLYDTYGFPLDLTQLIAAERNWSVDTKGFEQALQTQQRRSRQVRLGDTDVASRAGEDAVGTIARPGAGGKWVRVIPRKRQRFVGYETTRAETEILCFRRKEAQLDLILRDNPFYAESGGQVSDKGVVRGEGWELRVDDVRREEGNQFVTGSVAGSFEPSPVDAEVAEQRRRNIERNHTATHLVHAALRAALGEHVRQAGSVVAPDRLRFDFSHHGPLTPAELREIEEDVNDGIWRNAVIETYEMTYRDALAKGAMALFGEKYGDRVRVVDIPGLSIELCGGTHVRSTGQIGLFHFTHETGVAAGVRRIEAVTGPGAYERVRQLDARILAAAETLRTTPEHVAHRIEQLLDERRKLEKQIEELLKRESREPIAESRGIQVGDATLVLDESPVAERNQIGVLMDAFRAQQARGVKVLFTGGDRPGVHVAVTDDLISRGLRAGDLVKLIVAVSGGSGGGRPHFASGGLGDPARFDETRRQVPEIVRLALAGATG
jgi:alanyl-tRNA synthetase